MEYSLAQFVQSQAFRSKIEQMHKHFRCFDKVGQFRTHAPHISHSWNDYRISFMMQWICYESQIINTSIRGAGQTSGRVCHKPELLYFRHIQTFVYLVTHCIQCPVKKAKKIYDYYFHRYYRKRFERELTSSYLYA